MESAPSHHALLASLPPVQRLALAYAPATTRGPIAVLLALDTRLAGIVRSSREPMLAQLRLAWWREQLALDPARRPDGEPLLAALALWPSGGDGLAGLVDGWEALTGPAPLPDTLLAALAEARGAAFAALAPDGDTAGNALRMGRNWALADIAAHLGDPREREVALALARAQDWSVQRLGRGLRPLAVLHGLARSAIRMDNPRIEPGPGTVLRAMRIGLLGR